MSLHPPRHTIGKGRATATRALRASIALVIFGLGAVVALGGGTLIAVQCFTSNAVRTRAEKLLTPNELKTLRPAADFCSGTYVFKRNGENLCITSGNGEIGGCG